MAQSLTPMFLILGAGLAGYARPRTLDRTEGHIDIACVKVQLMRAHSVCAEGARGRGCARTRRTHRAARLDQRKGSDFLADQDVVCASARRCARDPAARPLGHPVDARRQGPHQPAAVRPGIRTRARRWQADKTGFFEMQTLYRQLLRYQCFKRYDELFSPTSSSRRDGFVALVGIHAPSGEDRGPAGEGAAHRVGRRGHAVRLHGPTPRP